VWTNQTVVTLLQLFHQKEIWLKHEALESVKTDQNDLNLNFLPDKTTITKKYAKMIINVIVLVSISHFIIVQDRHVKALPAYTDFKTD
jgi:hypothetical protein